MLGMLLSLITPVLAEEQSPTTPEAVWADFDPRNEPLEIEVTKRWADHGSNLTVPADAFPTDNGQRLKGWHGVQQLALKTAGGAGDQPIYGMFRWVPSVRP